MEEQLIVVGSWTPVIVMASCIAGLLGIAATFFVPGWLSFLLG